MAFGEDVGFRMFSSFYCSITSRQLLKHMFKLGLRGLLLTVIGRCMVLGGPSDLVLITGLIILLIISLQELIGVTPIISRVIIP